MITTLQSGVLKAMHDAARDNTAQETPDFFFSNQMFTMIDLLQFFPKTDNVTFHKPEHIFDQAGKEIATLETGCHDYCLVLIFCLALFVLYAKLCSPLEEFPNLVTPTKQQCNAGTVRSLHNAGT
jgi:hypothetical protein